MRGFSGAAGNVLVDGARPASRDEGLSDILNRIPAAQVERVELIRGGALGIGMLGFTQVVNVVRRQESTRQHVVTLGGIVFDDGRGLPSGRYELKGTVFDGTRDRGVVRFVEDRVTEPESRVQFRLRQTF